MIKAWNSCLNTEERWYHSGGTMSTNESLLKKYLVIPCLLITTIVSVLLIVGKSVGKSNRSYFYYFVVNHRASVQIIVQILSRLFGTIHVFALTTLINFRTRLVLGSQKPVPLNSLNFWNGLYNRRFSDFTIPWIFGIGLLGFWGLKIPYKLLE
jgi:hypothetical protein